MRILLLTTRFSPHIGGVENVVENLAQNWSSDNEICVLTSKEAKSFTDIENPIEIRDTYKLKRIWMGVPRSFAGFIAFPIRFILSLRALKKFVKEYNPDVVNIHFLDDVSIYAALALGMDSFKVVVNIHGNDIQVFAKNPFYAIFIGGLLSTADKIIVNSKYMYEQVLAFNAQIKSKLAIIPNGLNTEEFKEIPSKKFLNDDYIFYLGRVVHKKGLDILIRAFDKAAIDGLKLVIEGKGEELNNIKNLVKELKQESNIIFTNGNLSFQQKIEVMKGSLFGIIPSRIEPFGIIALEYIASGTPVIVSKTGGLIDLIQDNKTGIFFENENIDELSSSIKNLYTNEAIRKKISENQIAVATKFDWNDISEDYLKLFKEL